MLQSQKCYSMVDSFSILVTDFQFARTKGMNYIGFASAGDCYSAKNCAQGRFSINLRHTGFRVSADTEWRSLGGPYTYKNIDRKKVCSFLMQYNIYDFNALKLANCS